MTTINSVNLGLSGATGTGNFVGANTPTLITPVLGAATATSITFNPTTDGIVGTTTNNNASAGYVGQLISSVISSGAPVSYTSTGTADLTSISLTAGDWDVHGNILFVGTTIVSYGVWISLTSATVPDLSLITFAGPGTTVGGINAPYFRASLAMTTTVYLTGTVTGTGTLTGQGGIYARRVR